MDEPTRVNYTNEIPPCEGVFIPILSPKPGAPIRGFLLSDELVGVNTHFYMDRTVPCKEPESKCIGCQYGLHKRWKCYLGCWSKEMTRLVLVELTRKALEESLNIPKARTIFRRGLEIIVQRRGTKNNAPLLFELNANRNPGCELPKQFDIRAALERIWYGNRDGRKVV